MEYNSNNFNEVLNSIEAGDYDDHDFVSLAFVPDAYVDDSVAIDENPDSDGDNDLDGNDVSGGRYEVISENYNSAQRLLEENHTYKWIEGEAEHQTDIETKIFLSDDQKSSVNSMSKTDLFELFFSNELKDVIITASKENDINLTFSKLENFIGILLVSIINTRKDTKDYWSKNNLLSCKMVMDCMSRNDFLNIKRRLKYSRNEEKNITDKIWRVRAMVDIFRKNLQQFGFFSSNMSIDESMIKFFGRSSMKQFMPKKPIRFGLKLWALCTTSGFLLDFHIYCGKGGSNEDKLKKCCVGSKVVMQELHNFLRTVPRDRLTDYHVTFDNFFTSPDLLVHLNKLGLKATGTVRKDRVYEMDSIKDKKGKAVLKRKPVPVCLTEKSDRGSSVGMHDIGSKTNFISVKDSKIVSLLTTAANSDPKVTVKRWNSTAKEKTDISFPFAFALYNKTMGGVDMHDRYCSDLSIQIRSRKWTWSLFCRIIEASISNAFILWKHCTTADDAKKVGVKDFVLAIAEDYLSRNSKKWQSHNLCCSTVRRVCQECSQKVPTHCVECGKHFCVSCYNQTHRVVVHVSKRNERKKNCCGISCNKRTSTFCPECNEHVCPQFPEYHKAKKIKSI